MNSKYYSKKEVLQLNIFPWNSPFQSGSSKGKIWRLSSRTSACRRFLWPRRSISYFTIMSPNMGSRASSSPGWWLISASRTKSTPAKLPDRSSRESTLPRLTSSPPCLKSGNSSWASMTSIYTLESNGSSEFPTLWSAQEATSQCTTRPPKSVSLMPIPSGSRSSNISRLCSKTVILCIQIRIVLSRP